MTNAEKFEEVFGLIPDYTACPTRSCSECPTYNKGYDCSAKWWESEYKERGKA